LRASAARSLPPTEAAGQLRKQPRGGSFTPT
jgi:hypothetical protein